MMADPIILLELPGLAGTYSQVDKLYGRMITLFSGSYICKQVRAHSMTLGIMSIIDSAVSHVILLW